jgi:ectoine hydroxylase-related dioxygenase (phytanoyl-CoA dioxygenase family)
VFDHAIYKPPHNHTPTGWHQDEVYSKSPLPLRTIHFWIPLQAATVENGCMWYVPGSHLRGSIPHRAANVRTAGSSDRVTGTTFVVDAVDDGKAVVCPVPAGGVTLHHPLTLHYAGPNQSDDYRRAWILHFGAYGKWRYRLHPKSLRAKLSKALTPGGR